jgi:hypothetical protein
VTNAYASFLSETPRSWRRAFLAAALIEGPLALVFLIVFVAPVPVFVGADNPSLFYLGGILHLPSALLFPILDRATTQLMPESAAASLMMSCSVIALSQFFLIAVLVRKPWRRPSNGSVV